jgi:hypothetical protein
LFYQIEYPNAKIKNYVVSSNSRTEASRPPTAIRWPSGLKASDDAPVSASEILAALAPVVGFQNSISPVKLLVTSAAPSGEKAIPMK